MHQPQRDFLGAALFVTGCALVVSVCDNTAQRRNRQSAKLADFPSVQPHIGQGEFPAQAENDCWRQVVVVPRWRRLSILHAPVKFWAARARRVSQRAEWFSRMSFMPPWTMGELRAFGIIRCGRRGAHDGVQELGF